MSALGGEEGSETTKYDDDRTHASAPPRMGGDGAATTTALAAVLAALSNYGDVGVGDDDSDSIPDNSNDGSANASAAGNSGRHHHRTAVTGWGIESHIEGSRSWDRPIVLGGSEGILAARVHHHRPRRPRPGWDDGMGNPKEDGGDGVHHDMHHPPSPYHFMVEDYDNNDGAATSSSSSAAADRYARLLCIKGGSSGYPAHNWAGAFQDGRQELVDHFREHWRDIMDDEESNRLERCLLIIEYPMTLARKVRARVCLNGFIDIWVLLTILFRLPLFLQLTVPIPCEGSYCRSLVAISSALSPLWLGFYLMNSFEVNIWGCQLFGVYVSLAIVIGLLILRYAPGGNGIMSPYIAVRCVSLAYWIQTSEVLVPGCQSLIHARTFRGMCRYPLPYMVS